MFPVSRTFSYPPVSLAASSVKTDLSSLLLVCIRALPNRICMLHKQSFTCLLTRLELPWWRFISLWSLQFWQFLAYGPHCTHFKNASWLMTCSTHSFLKSYTFPLLASRFVYFSHWFIRVPVQNTGCCCLVTYSIEVVKKASGKTVYFVLFSTHLQLWRDYLWT